MGAESRHPLFTDRVFDWEQMLDTYRGQRRIKEKGTRYMPPTQTMVADAGNRTLSGLINTSLIEQTNEGQTAYTAYLTRAVFPEVVRPAVEGFVGIMHQKPATIELPAAMESLREDATVQGESLEMLLRQINEYQLLFGRMGLLAEVPMIGGPSSVPFIAPYAAPRIINWDDGRRDQGSQQLELVVLDESENERTSGFDWEFEKKLRVLIMSNQTVERNSTDQAAAAGGVYQVQLLRDGATEIDTRSLVTPTIAGQKMDEIPFVFVNTKDLSSSPDEPPLLGLSDLSLTIYRGEADLRQALFLQGQETLVIIGGGETEGEDDVRVGAGQRLELPGGGDAKYIGVSAQGLAEMRSALEGDHARAAESGSKLLDFSDSGRQSGEALRIRMAAKTATIQNIAVTGAEGLKQSLRQIAKWIGADPDEVRVTPNLDFASETNGGGEMVSWMQAKRMGLPISSRSLHRIICNNDNTAMSFEEEQAEIENEEPVGGDGLGVGAEETDDDDDTN